MFACFFPSFLPAFKLRLGQQQPESQKRDQNNNHAFPIRKYSSIYRIFFFFFFFFFAVTLRAAALLLDTKRRHFSLSYFEIS
jgi:hypothetical protein